MTGEGKDSDRLLREFEANEDVKTRFAACLRSDFLVCEFARGVSSLLDFNVVWKKDDYAPAFIDERIRIATERGQMCIIIMPPVKTPIALARLISALQEGQRWKVQVEGEAVGRSRVVNISWCGGDTPASVMGFFPGGVMPVTRRTPYAAMAIWAAGAKNIHRKRPGDSFGPGDMPVPESIPPAKYSEMRSRIVKRLQSAHHHQFEGAILDHTTFCVDEDALRSAGLIG